MMKYIFIAILRKSLSVYFRMAHRNMPKYHFIDSLLKWITLRKKHLPKFPLRAIEIPWQPNENDIDIGKKARHDQKVVHQ